jgi:hypothetical protein
MPGKKKYYWDSCTFIAWLKGEKHNLGELEGIEAIAKLVMENKADLFTSELTRTEVLEGKMTAEERERFQRLFQRRNVVSVDLSGRVMDLSRAIREWNNDIGTQDSIHLATAILYEANEFHTTDGGGKRKRRGDLIPLNGNVAGHALRICTPVSTQPNLFSGVAAIEIGESKKEQGGLTDEFRQKRRIRLEPHEN